MGRKGIIESIADFFRNIFSHFGQRELTSGEILTIAFALIFFIILAIILYFLFSHKRGRNKE